MAGGEGDIFVILTLWMLYIGIHVCMDFFERRARRFAEAEAEQNAERHRHSIFREVMHGEDGRRTRAQREVHVVVVGAETDPATLNNREPCEGALVPDANGHMPQLPDPVHYGEAAYAARNEDVEKTTEVVEVPDEKPVRNGPS